MTNGCLWTGELRGLDDHVAKKCWHKIVTCKFAKIGCDKTFYRKQIQEHEADNERHLDLAMATILKLEERTTHMKYSLPNTKFTFKLSEFTKHKTNETEFNSSPFHTSPTGYKMCISVDANGIGSVKGTHVSVYAHLMKGDNDDSLTWPFTGTVTYELLNQLEDKNHQTYTIAPFPADNDKVSGRVVNGERGVGWGCPKFIPPTELDYNADKNCQYLKNDTLIFRVSVEIPDYKPWLECTV